MVLIVFMGLKSLMYCMFSLLFRVLLLVGFPGMDGVSGFHDFDGFDNVMISEDISGFAG